MSNPPEQWQSIIAHLDSIQGDVTSDVETIIESISETQDISRWIIGDALRYVGTNSHNLDYFSKLARVEVSTLRSYLTTAKTFLPELRWSLLEDYPSLSFAIFKECNSVASEFGLDTAIDLLKRAGDNLYTVKELKFYIATELKKQDKKEFELIADSVGLTWVDAQNETLNIELGDELALLLEIGKSYRIKIYEENDHV
jgi:hypothetical protein